MKRLASLMKHAVHLKNLVARGPRLLIKSRFQLVSPSPEIVRLVIISIMIRLKGVPSDDQPFGLTALGRVLRQTSGRTGPPDGKAGAHLVRARNLRSRHIKDRCAN